MSAALLHSHNHPTIWLGKVGTRRNYFGAAHPFIESFYTHRAGLDKYISYLGMPIGSCHVQPCHVATRRLSDVAVQQVVNTCRGLCCGIGY